MKYHIRAPLIGVALALTMSAAGANAAQSQQHEHQANPPAHQTPAGQVKDMHAMMADPAMRQKMMAQMGQCRDMMSKMMEHMKHLEHGRQTDTNTPATPKQ